MSSPDAAALARKVAALERRLRALEGSTQLSRAAVMNPTDGSSMDVADGLATAYTAATDAGQALLDAADAAALADNKQTIYFNVDASPPTDHQPGDLWLHPNAGSTTPGLLQRWDGLFWVDSSDARLATALAAAQNAQDTADAKIETTRGTTLPVTASQGDLHYLVDASSGVVLSMHRWEAGLWVQMPLGTLTTADYVEGETGTGINPTTTQFENVNVVGVLGAGRITADSIALDGADLADTLDQIPGIVAYARRPRSGEVGVNSGNVSGTGSVGLLELAVGAMKTGRLYRIHAKGNLSSDTADSTWDLRVRYTTDGTAPTASSGILDGSATRVAFSVAPASSAFHLICYFRPGGNYDSVRMLLTLQRVLGSGSAWITGTDINRAFEWLVEYVGLVEDPDLSPGATLAQILKADGSPAEPTPTKRQTLEWPATWWRSYNEAGATLAGDPQTDLYQGEESASVGHRRGLVGFDYADITAKLAGSTILDVAVIYKVRQATEAAGLDVRWTTHAATVKPATWAATPLTPLTDWNDHKAGTSHTDVLPVEVGEGFRDATIRGLGVGHGVSSSAMFAGRLYGSASPLRLRITFDG